MSDWLYSNSSDNKNRFILGEKGLHPLICIGINPSTATPSKLDNTLRTVKNRALSLGYDSWIMINIYPQRATEPKNLDKQLNSETHKKNIEELKNLFSNTQHDIWAAWGTSIKIRPYLTTCLQEINQVIPSNNAKWFTIGKRSKEGHPHHPLYLKKCLSLDIFDIDGYLIEQTK
ncbi:MAG: DUF1643 domain-containing protein [Candidatus Gracilibacteria bacterium]|jgi:hypothetical protein